MTQREIDYADIQGLVRFGYKKMTEASYVLLRVKNAGAARAWLRSAPITSAVTQTPPPTTALQVAFTSAGLAAIGVPAGVLAGFSSEFLTGTTMENRLRRLGDVGQNAPSNWDWGGSASTVPHLVVMFFSEPGGLDALVGRTADAAWNAAFTELRTLGTGDLKGHEPFGFTDGISQPAIDWEQQRGLPSGAKLDYGNVAALGEFVLGYRNEYGKYTDRPTLDANAASASLSSAEDAPDKKDLGRNGTYVVMRQLEQDVRKFWQFIGAYAGTNPGDADAFAAALVGRMRGGEPLVPVQQQSIPGVGTQPDDIRLNQFTFEGDPRGDRCPFGAHIRRANPRNADFAHHPTGLTRLMAMIGLGRKAFVDDLMSSVRYHRILRRGREYGPGLSPSDALAPAPPNDPARGLQFLCVNANISRQFEFLQNAWIMSTKFSGMTGESDALLGNREPVPGCPSTTGFSTQEDGTVCRRVDGLPQFVTVRGSAYFFLPSLRAVRFFAAIGES